MSTNERIFDTGEERVTRPFCERYVLEIVPNLSAIKCAFLTAKEHEFAGNGRNTVSES